MKKTTAISIFILVVLSNLPVISSAPFNITDAILIDETSDYNLLGIPLDKITHKYVYTPQVLCEGHLVFAIKLNNPLNLNSNQIKKLLNHSILEGARDGTFEYYILINESYQRKEKIYEDYWEYEDEIWIKSWQGSYNLVDDYRYIWRNIKDLDSYTSPKDTYIFLDLAGTFTASLAEFSIDVAPMLEIDAFSHTFNQWAWWDTDWTYYTKITVANSFVTNDTSGFPLTVYLSDAIGDKADDGDSIRFVNSANDTEFKYDKDYWVDNELRVFHVNITEVVTSGSDFTFNVYYNNSGASAPTYVASDVWDINYSAVYHLGDASGNILDSAWKRNGTGITGNPLYQQTGKVGYGMTFDGTLDGAKIPEDFGFASLPKWSVEIWYNGNSWDSIGGKDNFFTPKGEVKSTAQWNDADDQIDFQWKVSGVVYYAEVLKDADAPPPVDTWQYVACTYDTGDVGRVFHNASYAAENTSGAIEAQAYQNYIGCGSDNADLPNNEFDGTLDEVRVSDTKRNATWLELSFHSQNNSDGFISFGTEQIQVGEPTSFVASTWSSSQINLSWTKGDKATHTHIQRKTNSYPTDISDGTTAYNNTGTSYDDSGLSLPGKRYYYRAWSWNSTTKQYSPSYAEIINLTKPEAPTGFTVTRNNGTQTDLGWTMGTGATRTHIQYEKNSYPTDINDGTTMYNNTGTTKTHTGLTGGETYYYRGWSYDTNGGFHQYSDGYIEGNLLLTPDPSYAITFEWANDTGINLTFTKGNGTTNSSIRYSSGSYPLDYNDGTNAYNGSNSYVNISGLTISTQYFFRFWSWVNSTFSTTNTSFSQYTRPLAPTNLVVRTLDLDTTTGKPRFNLTWTKGIASDYTVIRFKKNDEYPTSPTDGTAAYNGTLTYRNVSKYAMDVGTLHNFRAWAWNSTTNLYSNLNITVTNLSKPRIPTDIAITDEATTSFNITYNDRTEANNTIIRRYNGSINPTLTTGFEVANNSNPSSYEVDTGIAEEIEYRYSLWSYTEHSGFHQYSNATSPDWGFAKVYVFNESDGTKIDGWDIFIKNNDASSTYNDTGCDNGKVINVSEFPIGNPITVQVNHTDYDTRNLQFDLEDMNYRWYNITFYLPPVNTTNLYLIVIIDEYEQRVDDAYVQISKFISTTGEFEMLGARYTDGNGEAVFYLEPEILYNVNISKTGYITENNDYYPDPDYYGMYYPKTFKISTTPIVVNITGFWDVVTFNGTMHNNNTIHVIYEDSLTNTTNTKFLTYELFNTTLSLNATNTTTNNTFDFWITGINISRMHQVILYLNHTNIGFTKQSILISPLRTPKYSKSAIETAISNVAGTFTLGYVNFFFIFLPAIVVLVLFNPSHSYIGIIGSGFYIGFTSLYFTIPEELFLSIPFIIGLGLLLAVIKGRSANL